MGKYYSIPLEALNRVRANRKPRSVTCGWCGTKFQTTAGNAKYCREECAAKGRLMKLSQASARRAGGSKR